MIHERVTGKVAIALQQKAEPRGSLSLWCASERSVWVVASPVYAIKPLHGATEEGQAPGWGHRGTGPNGEPKLVRFAKWLGFTEMFDKASCSGLEGQRADYGPCCLWHGKNNSSWHCALPWSSSSML